MGSRYDVLPCTADVKSKRVRLPSNQPPSDRKAVSFGLSAIGSRVRGIVPIGSEPKSRNTAQGGIIKSWQREMATSTSNGARPKKTTRSVKNTPNVHRQLLKRKTKRGH